MEGIYVAQDIEGIFGKIGNPFLLNAQVNTNEIKNCMKKTLISN